MNVPSSYIRRYWFGIDEEDAIADTVLLMERDRLDQYRGAFDDVHKIFHGVFSGFTGRLNGKRISVVYSIGPAHIADCVTFLSYGCGVKRFFSTGSVGGLTTEMGDIIVSNSCKTLDGYSCASFPGEVQYEPNLGYVLAINMSLPVVVSSSVHRHIKEMFDCDIRYGTVFTLPAISLEDERCLSTIKEGGHIAVDLETGPFIAACRRCKAQAICVHWVTDLPLERSFYFQFDGDPKLIAQDWDKKHRQWLNMPRLILPIVGDLMEAQE